MPNEYSLEKIIPLLESTPNGNSRYYEKWQEALLNGAAPLDSEFHKEYYCEIPDSMLVNNIIPGSSKDIQLKKLATEVKNLTLHYAWEYVGIEEEDKIQNSWMVQIFIDKIQELLTNYRTKTVFQLDKMLEFVTEKRFYTLEMERAFEVIAFDAVRRQPIIGHFHISSTSPQMHPRGMQIYGSVLDDSFTIPASEVNRDRYSRLPLVHTPNFISINAES